MNKILSLSLCCMLVALQMSAQAPNVSYPSSSYSFFVGTAINQLTPTNTGGAIAAPGSVSVSVVTTLAGSGTGAYADGTGTAASFYFPSGVALEGNGNVYVADQNNHRIRKISPSGVVTTLAGSGPSYPDPGGFANGTGTAASFAWPSGVALDGSGNVYVADQNNDRIRKINTAGVVATFAGSGNAAFANGVGTAASFIAPTSVAVDGSGNVYVADVLNQSIRKISPLGMVTTLAGSGCSYCSGGYADGTGAAAIFASPVGVAVDGSGNVYVADQYNHRIRKISPAGVVTTLAGSGIQGNADGTGTAASFKYPSGVAVDGNGNVYVGDQYNHRIRKISPAGVVTTLAGSGTGAYADGIGTTASFKYPFGVAVDGSGNVFVADGGNNRIRKISPGVGGGYTVSPALPAGLTLNATTGVISGTPSAAAQAASYVITATNAGGSNSFTVNITVTAVAGPTITTLSPVNFYCSGSTVAIGFSASGFDTANVFTAQLSNSSGSFSSPVTLGTLNGATGGAISATLPSGQAAGTGYRIRILATIPATNGANNGTNLTINAGPTSAQSAVTPTSAQSICPGASVTFKVPKNTGFTYQWLLGGTSIAGATDTSYVANAAGVYSVTVTNANGCSLTSSNRTVNLLTAPIASINPSTTQTFTGSPILLSANTGTGLTYEWRLNGATISGATASTYSVTAVGNYSVTVTNSGGCAATSSAVTIQAAATPVTISGTGTRTKCAGDTIKVAFTGSGFTAGNVFTLQLSNASGSFTTPQDIGTLTATTAGTLVGTIPTSTPVGNGYKLRINSSNPVSTGVSSVLTLRIRKQITDTIKLCAVTVDSATGKNKLVWNKPLSTNIDSFVFYRKADNSAGYKRVGSQAYSVFSTWNDSNSEPSVRSARYYLTGKNTCGETPNTGVHTTMLLSISAGQNANTWILIWNGYEGFSHEYYNIWRGTSPNNLSLLTTTQARSFNSYNDLNAPAGTVYYRVSVGDGPSCNPSLRTTGEDSWISSNIATNAKVAVEATWDDLSVFPNPSQEGAQILVQSSDAGTRYEVRVMDIAGRVVLTTNAEVGKAVSFGAQLVPGIYTIEAANGGRKMVQKWVKQ